MKEKRMKDGEVGGLGATNEKTGKVKPAGTDGRGDVESAG